MRILCQLGGIDAHTSPNGYDDSHTRCAETPVSEGGVHQIEIKNVRKLQICRVYIGLLTHFRHWTVLTRPANELFEHSFIEKPQTPFFVTTWFNAPNPPVFYCSPDRRITTASAQSTLFGQLTA